MSYERLIVAKIVLCIRLISALWRYLIVSLIFVIINKIYLSYI